MKFDHKTYCKDDGQNMYADFQKSCSITFDVIEQHTASDGVIWQVVKMKNGFNNIDSRNVLMCKSINAIIKYPGCITYDTYCELYHDMPSISCPLHYLNITAGAGENSKWRDKVIRARDIVFKLEIEKCAKELELKEEGESTNESH